MDPISLAATAIGTGAKLWGASQDRKSQQEMAAQNIALQREFAQNGVQWKVEDAKKAGIHPLFALGANTHSFSPVSVGSNMAGAFSDLGQDLSRAMQSGSSASDRQSQVAKSLQELSLRRAGLENELLSAQIAKIKSSVPPPVPTANQRWLLDGQGQTPLSDPQPSGVPGTLIKTEPLERQASDPQKPYMEAGAVADMGFARTANGYAPIPSKDVQERQEDNMIAQWSWALRNQLLPTFSFNQNPPNVDPGPGYKWVYHPFYQEYRRMKWRGVGPIGTYW